MQSITLDANPAVDENPDLRPVLNKFRNTIPDATAPVLFCPVNDKVKNAAAIACMMATARNWQK